MKNIFAFFKKNKKARIVEEVVLLSELTDVKERKFDPFLNPELGLETIYKLNYISYEEMDRFPDGINDLHQGRQDGFIIKGFLTPEKVNLVNKNYEKVKNGIYRVNFGEIYGTPLNASGESRENYLDDAQKFNAEWTEMFGFDLVARIKEMLSHMSGGRNVSVPIENGREYLAGNIRVYYPGAGGLFAHTGNEFAMINKSVGLEMLMAESKLINSMSYFIQLSVPQKGGQLVLFDLLYENTPQELFGFNGNERNDDPFRTMKHQIVHLEPGDFLVFAAGHIWHKVIDIGGETNRMTWGGFQSISNDDKNLWFWS